MGITITVQNVLGIRHAEIDLPDTGVLEIIGPNASGKTSVAVCVQALLSHEMNPLGLSGPQAKRAYPNDQGDAGSARSTLATPAYSIDWYPASAKLQAPIDTPPLANRAAVGLVDFAGSKASAVAQEFQAALLPPAHEVIAKVREHLAAYLPADDLAGAVKTLKQRGWQPTQAVYTDRAKQAKREWSAITGSNYGVKVSADWRPEGWHADYDSMTPEQTETRVVDAREALADLHRIQAIGELELAEAQQAAEVLPQLDGEVSLLQSALQVQRGNLAALGIDQLEHERATAMSRLEWIQRDKVKTHECPKCNAPLMIEGDRIVAKSLAKLARRDNDQQAAQDDIAKIDSDLQKRLAESDSMQLKIVETKGRLDDARARRHSTEQQAANADMVVDTPARQAELAKAEQRVSDAREVATMVSNEANARQIRETIVRYTEIAKALGPDGIRSKMLAAGMRRLNAGLGVLADVAGWPLVVGALNGGITSDDRPIALCSESERWRAQASIQLTLAALTDAQAVVLDRADLLDGVNRAGLHRGLQRVVDRSGLTVLLCSTGTASATDAPWPQVAIKDGNIAGK